MAYILEGVVRRRRRRKKSRAMVVVVVVAMLLRRLTMTMLRRTRPYAAVSVRAGQ